MEPQESMGQLLTVQAQVSNNVSIVSLKTTGNVTASNFQRGRTKIIENLEETSVSSLFTTLHFQFGNIEDRNLFI